MAAKSPVAQKNKTLESLTATLEALVSKSPNAQMEGTFVMMMLMAQPDRSVLESLRARMTTHPNGLQALAATLLVARAPGLTQTQAGQALESLLTQIGQTTDPDGLEPLAQALQALAPKLSEAQAAQAWEAAAASLGWAASGDEAAEWARALVALSGSAANRDVMLMNAIAYPAAAGSATEVLLDAIRAGHPDAPTKDKGTQVALEWLAKKFPDVLHPGCPPPLQRDLKCPPSASQQN